MRKYQPDIGFLNRHWRRVLYSRIENIFSYENLPEEINERAFKLFLFKCGKVLFFKIGDKVYVQPFSYTDKLDPYYIPKNGRVVNPWLPLGHQNFEFEVDKSAVIWNSTPDIYNFRDNSIVSDLIYKTATQLSENDLSYYCIQRNARLVAIFMADSDIEKAECNRILDKMYNGDPDITMGQDLISRITTMSISENSMRGRLTELIEFQQYILANFYHAFGINSNYNLKREQLNSNEIDVNKEVLSLNIEDLLTNREMGVSKVNELLGLDIRVSLNEKVYTALLQEQAGTSGQFAGNTGLLTFTKDSKNYETTTYDTMRTGAGEDKNKSNDDGNTSGNFNSGNTATGQESIEEPTSGRSVEETSETSEISEFQIQVEAETVKIEITDEQTQSNLGEKGEENERPDSN